MSGTMDRDSDAAHISRALADSLADYTPPKNGELHLPAWDEQDWDERERVELAPDVKPAFTEPTSAIAADTAMKNDAAYSSAATHDAVQTALPIDTPVPPVQAEFDGWSTSYDQVDSGISGIKAEPDEFRVRPQSAQSEIDSSFDITRVFSQTGSKIQRQTKEWGNATVAVFAARKEQHNLIWLGLAALIAIVALIWLFKPAEVQHIEEQVISIQPQPASPVEQTITDQTAIAATAAAPANSAPQINSAVEPVTMPDSPAAVATAAAAKSTAAAAPAKAVDVYQPAPTVAAKPAVSTQAPAAKSQVHTQAASVASKGGFTVQIAAAHNEANIKSLAAKLPKPAEAQIVRTWRDGKPWYVLYYGHFRRHEDAARARDALPVTVKSGNSPWIKAL